MEILSKGPYLISLMFKVTKVIVITVLYMFDDNLGITKYLKMLDL